jgi:hypothetical protein
MRLVTLLTRNYGVIKSASREAFLTLMEGSLESYLELSTVKTCHTKKKFKSRDRAD